MGKPSNHRFNTHKFQHLGYFLFLFFKATLFIGWPKKQGLALLSLIKFGVKLCQMFENLFVYFEQLIIFIILFKSILQRDKQYA